MNIPVTGLEHLHLHTDFSLLDGFGMVEEYTERWKKHGRFLCISDHGMMGAVPRQIKACEAVCEELKDKNAFSPIFACFFEDYLVHTLNGCKRIADIKCGDLVLTHRGRFQPVVAPMSRSYQGQVVEIKLSGVGRSSRTITVTEEHPFLVRDRYGEVSWVKAKDLKGGYPTTEKGIATHNMYLGLPRLRDACRRVIVEAMLYMDPSRVGRDGETLYAVTQSQQGSFAMPAAFELDEEFAYLLGLFAAEGSYSKDSTGKLTGGLRLSLHADEIELIERVSPVIKRFATAPIRREKTDGQGIDVTFASVPLAVILSHMVGVGAANKKVPAEIMSSPRVVQRAFIDGLLAGDGKQKVDGVGQTTLKVRSRDLAYGLKVLLAASGRWAMVYPVGEHFCVPVQDDAKYRRFLVDDEFVWKPIDTVVVKELDHEVMVYNFEVAEDNSYVGDVTVHNCELYVNRYHTEATPDVASREKLLAGMTPEEKAGFKVRGSHLLAIAYNEVGYSNLVRMTTWAYLNGFYGKPRVNYEQLLKHKEGLIFTSCCYNSEIGRAFEYGGTSYEEKREAAAAVIERYIEMFGREHFYLEIMLLDFEKQKPYDKFIIWAADKYKLRLIVTNDCHYCLPEDSEYQRLMLMQQTGKTVKDIQKALNEEGIKDLFELQDQNLWMKTEEELNEMWEKKYSDVIDLDIFQCAKANTVKVCEMCKGVKLDRRNKLPKLKNAEDELQTHILNGFRERHIVGKHYKARAAQEYELICRKGFASYFLIQKKMVDEARRYYRDVLKLGSGYEAVGPGRGCLHPDAGVIVNRSVKRIADVVPGDVVVCHDGVRRPVKKVWDYPCDEELVNIGVFYGDDAGLTLTPDHKVLVSRGRRPSNWNNWAESTKKSRRAWELPGDLTWERADSVSPGDWLFYPKPVFPSYDFTPVDFADFISSDDMRVDGDDAFEVWMNPTRTGVRRERRCSRRFDFTPLFAKILGYFVGDGWLCADSRPQVGFAFHNKTDRAWMLEVVDFFTALGCHVRVSPSKTKCVTQVLICNRFVYNLFYSLHPRYRSTSQTKHVPDEIFHASEEIRRSYLNGYLQADGSGKKYKTVYSTTSYELASGVRLLILMSGLPAGISRYERLDSRSGKLSVGWTITSPLTVSSARYVWHPCKDGVLCQVKTVGRSPASGRVYDLMVDEGQPNYLTTNGLVHNSAVGALTCYLLGITDVDPVEEDLLFDRFLSDSRGGRQIKLRFSNIDPVLSSHQ